MTEERRCLAHDEPAVRSDDYCAKCLEDWTDLRMFTVVKVGEKGPEMFEPDSAA